MIPISLMVGGEEEDSSNPLGGEERSDLSRTKAVVFLKMIIPKGWKRRARCFEEEKSRFPG